MSIPVLIIGEPGSGKTYSMRNFEQGEIGVLQTIRKPLPFKGNLERASSRDINQIRAWLNGDTMHKAIMIDDFGYLITDTYMRHSYGAEKYRDQYEVYKQIGSETYGLITDLMDDGRDDRIVYMTMHVERDNFGNIEPSTVGKMLNEKVKLIGMFTICLMAVSDSDGYRFITNGQPLKSPPGMFDIEIDNDLKAVDDAIREYYEMEPLSVVGKGGEEPKNDGSK